MLTSPRQTAVCLLLVLVVTVDALCGIGDRERAKLHPALWGLLDQRAAIRTSPFSEEQESYIDAIILTNNPAALRTSGIEVHSVYPGFITARVQLADLERIVSLPSVIYVDPGNTNELHTDVSVPHTGAPLLHAGFVNGTPYRGAGAIVVVYDTGIDWKHLDFRDPVDTSVSRILYIWDQTLTPTGGESSPTGLGYGVEYTRAQIENEIDGSPTGFVRTMDTYGHGTHVAGTAAGDGAALNGKYTGMAPGADIIVVKGGNGSFSEARMIDGLTYAANKASALARPVAVNFSIGGQSGPHDGTRPYETAINSFVSTPGRVVVVSAGNDGSNAIHISGTVPSLGATTVTLTVPSYTPNSGLNNDNFTLELWFTATPSITATVTSPNAITYTRSPGQTGTAPSTSDGTIDLYNVTSALNGHTNVTLWVRDASGVTPRSGIWRLTLSNPSASSDAFDAWLSDRSIGTASTVTLVGGNTDKTVSMPGTATGALTVGSFVSKWSWPSYNGGQYSLGGTDRTNNISSFSSVGPTADGRLKPDITAPGEWIIATLSTGVDTTGLSPYIPLGKKHWAMSGTSMAAPHVTGAAAVLLGAFPALTSAEIKTLLTSTATGDTFATSLPNPIWGNGKMDLLRALARCYRPADDVLRTTLAYDDGSVNFSNTLTGTASAGVRFTATQTGRLTGLHMNLTSALALAIVGNGSATFRILSSVGGLPGTQIGSSVTVPFALLSRGTYNYVSMIDAHVSVSAGTEYFAVVSVVNPSDALGIRNDSLSVPTSTTFWYDGSSWTQWSKGHLRLRTVTAPEQTFRYSLSHAFPVNKGWNMVALPVAGSDGLRSTLFPSATSNSFAYSAASGYVVTDPLVQGPGYWLSFPSTQTVGVSGSTIDSDTLSVASGWNIIGSITVSSPTSEIVTIPSGIRVSEYFGFNRGYWVASSLTPGKSYWVRMSQPGLLIMCRANGATPKVDATMASRQAIALESADGSKQQFLLVDEGRETWYEAPPFAPEGAFDVRSSDGRCAASLGAGSIALDIHGGQYPLSLELVNGTGQKFSVVGSGSGMTYGTLSAENVIRVTQVQDTRIELVLQKSMPVTFALEQNYPNPFNVKTVISYRVPVVSQVRLIVYDLLGQEVATLVNDVRPAGAYSASFDASALASGMYLCRLSVAPLAPRDLVPTDGRDGKVKSESGSSSASYTQTRKMLLLK